MFSKACEYGIKASIFIAINSSKGIRATLIEISQEINSPPAFTAKILQILVKNNIIKSIKGAHGGFEISKENIKQINLAQIVNAIDGNKIYRSCALGLEKCDEQHPCPVHDKFKDIRNKLQVMLERTSLEELAFNIKSGDTFLKI